MVRKQKIGTLVVLLAFAIVVAIANVASAQWTQIPGSPNASTCLLLTDGSVICQQGEEANSWRRLTPDINGNYAAGSWTAIANLPAGHGPLYYASAVLADGRVVLIGGEYNSGVPNCPSNPACEVNLGAIFDPTAAPPLGTWTPITSPYGQVGDSDSFVLSDGRFILRHFLSTSMAQFNPGTLNFTLLGATGKADNNSEEGSTLLPDGTVLVVNAGTQGGTGSQIYNPVTNAWTSAGSTIVSLPDNTPIPCCVPEIGPQVLRPDGTVYVAGATLHNSVYSTITGLWTPAPDFPMVGGQQMVAADAPGALLTNGNVLIATSAFFDSPTHFFEFDGSSLILVTDPSNNGRTSYQGRLLVLPSGQVMFTNGTNDVELYTPGGTFANSWRPEITVAPATITAGQTYSISGRQFNGLSQASMYGDDTQVATNYPIVRIVNHATGHVFYARTHGHTSMGVATGSLIVTTQFDTPPGMESGPSDLCVVANGIPSECVVVNGPDLKMTKTHSPSVFTQGDTGDTFTLHVENVGPSATSGTVTVVDTLPGSLTATAMTGTGWTCVVATLTCTRANALAAGLAYPDITLTVDVSSTAPISVTNSATVSGGGDVSVNTAGNNTDDDTVAVRQRTFTTVLSATEDFHDQVTLEAHVTPVGVPGSVDFYVDGSFVGTGTYVQGTGVATLQWIITLASGQYDITANFTSGDPLYLDSTGTLVDGLTVTREETTLSYTGDTVIANGGTATMKGVLLEDGLVPIAGRTITFTLGTGITAQTCNGITNASGLATCAISPVAQPLGPGVVGDVFAGDTFYLPASASANTILFAFLTTGGFTVGDLSAAPAANVTFWDAQWAAVNGLSGGPASDSYKGFAATLSAEPPVCGATWTTSPGNSSNPPNGPLPSYMGVLVPSSVQKSGSTISGNIMRIVVVQTGPGYADNPGHAGVGTIVAEFCHQ